MSHSDESCNVKHNQMWRRQNYLACKISTAFGSLFIVGLMLIIYINLQGRRALLCQLSNHLLLSMSMIDVLNSIALGISILGQVPKLQHVLLAWGIY